VFTFRTRKLMPQHSQLFRNWIHRFNAHNIATLWGIRFEGVSHNCTGGAKPLCGKDSGRLDAVPQGDTHASKEAKRLLQIAEIWLRFAKSRYRLGGVFEGMFHGRVLKNRRQNGAP
jgi:hypothetical protein